MGVGLLSRHARVEPTRGLLDSVGTSWRDGGWARSHPTFLPFQVESHGPTEPLIRPIYPYSDLQPCILLPKEAK